MSDSLSTLAQHLNDLSLDSSHEATLYVQKTLNNWFFNIDEKKYRLMKRLGTDSSIPEAGLSRAIDRLLRIDDYTQCAPDSTICGADEDQCPTPTSPLPILPEIRISSLPSETSDRASPITQVSYQSDLKKRDERYYSDHSNSPQKKEHRRKRKLSLKVDIAAIANSNMFDLNGAAIYPSFLERTFASIDLCVVYALLEKMNYNAIETVRRLLSFDPNPTLSLVKEIEESGAKKAGWCYSHFKGQCTRKDCWYSHDLDTIICRHWFKGHCSIGDSCKFAHQWPSQVIREIRNHKNYDPENGVITIPSSLKVPPAYGSGSRGPSLDPLSVQSIENEFPLLSPTTITNIDTISNFQGPKYNDAAKSLDFRKGFSSGGPRASIKIKGSRIYKTSSYEQRTFPPFPQSPPIFPSGAILTKRYRELRKPAWDQEKVRDRAESKFREAINKGDRAAQKYYIDQKNEAHNKATKLHRQAAQTMFYERNKNIDPETMCKDEELYIDLHGLHRDEARHYLNIIFGSFSGIKTHSWVVTGAGNHSKKEKSKLFPAVIEYCHKSGLRYRHYKSKGREGIICVLIK
ncbi:hypothetical protein H4219_004009 [Mycoemilia scoparia]|uniref:Uncharacterized protein n=1 Tax=Mycoemilia scoparia TaxID=417184 RepID=A0A9W7ZTH9_9FUNG|nr:hypothetical protein H4219_004009 [Mycoemilia scoparia]